MTDSARLANAGRGCLGSLVSGGCGCAAFLVGAAAAIAFFAPQLMAGWGARFLEREIGKRIDGTVEVGDVALSWEGPQRAGSVTVHSAAGELLLQGSLQLPSLLSLLDRGAADRRFVLDLSLLRSRIDADGQSNLGRTFGVDAPSGDTIVRSVADWAVGQLEVARRGSDGASTTLRIEIAEAEIDDTASGRGEVLLRNVSGQLRASVSGLQVDLERATILPRGGEPAELAVDLAFGQLEGGDGGNPLAWLRADELLHASVQGEGLSRDLLMTLGLVPRVDPLRSPPDPRLRQDAFDRIGPLAAALAGALAARVDRLELEVGRVDGGGDDPRVRLDLEGPAGTLAVRGTLRRVAGPGGAHLFEAGDGGGLSFEVAGGPGHLGPLVEAAAAAGLRVRELPPGDAGAGADATAAAVRWRGDLVGFTVPVDPALLELGRFSDPTPSRGLAAHVAGALRGGSGRLLLRGGPRLELSAAAVAEPTPFDLVRLDHRLTQVGFEGGRGQFESSWVTRTRDGNISRVTGDLPTGLAQDEAFAVELHGVPISLLGGVFPLHPSVADLLERRIARVRVGGLDAALLTGATAWEGPLDVELVTQEAERIAGTAGPDGVRIPSARFDVPVDGAAVEHVLRATMPWFDDFRAPSPDASLDVVLEDFFVPADGLEQGLRGRVRLGPPRLEVKLAPGLLRDLAIEHAEGWVRWEPGPLEMTLDGAGASYEGVEFPLGDGAACLMRGWSRRDGYSLSGEIEARYLRRLEGGRGESRRVQIDISNVASGQPRVLVSAAEVVNVLDTIMGLLSPELRREVAERLFITGR